MIFRQFLHDEKSCISYLFGCTSQGRGVVVDPQLNSGLYIELADRLKMTITHVIDTHVHADHLSGARKLAKELGAQLCYHEAAPVKFDYLPLKEGDEIEAGRVWIKVLHTPGHTPESICLLVGDKARGGAPWFVLTGDTLFVGDVGRPDLVEEVEVAAAKLYDSLFSKVLLLDAKVEVYPAHFQGSVCGWGMSGKCSSTIGFERQFNYALKPRPKAEFVKFLSEDLSPRLPEFEVVRERNLMHA